MKKIVQKLLIVALVGVFVSSASALTLVNGGFVFGITDYDMGTQYSYDPVTGFSVVSNAPGAYVIDGAGNGTVPYVGPTTGLPGSAGADGIEDGWGIFKIESISTLGGTQYYADILPNQSLVGMFYGIDDTALSYDAVTDTITVAGQYMHIDLYELGFDINWDAVSGQGSSGRIAYDGYNGITNVGGTLILSALSRAGGVSGNPEYKSDVAASWDTGKFHSYVDTTGGTMQPFFDTNTQLGGTDLYVNGDITTGLGSVPPNPPPSDWDFRSHDPVYGSAIPEPLTMFGLLLGVGGLGRYIRRRKIS